MKRPHGFFSLRKPTRSCWAVVAWVDLTDPQLGSTLDQLQAHPKFKGVRHPVHDESDDGWLLRPDVLRGLKELERRKVPYDLLLRPQHLPVVIELMDRVPSLDMVIDHIAKPPIAKAQTNDWAQDMERIASAQHILVKLSGMITEAEWRSWTSDQLKPVCAARLEIIRSGSLHVRKRLAGVSLGGDLEGSVGRPHAGARSVLKQSATR